MTDIERIEELKSLAENATPGPWKETNGGFSSAVDYVEKYSVNGPPSDFFYLENYADARFIAAANPETVLWLIAQIPQWMPISEPTKYAWSVCGEDYSNGTFDSVEACIESAIEYGDLEDVYVGEVEQPNLAALCGDWAANHLIENVFDCYTDDFGGEWWESDVQTMEKESMKSLAPFIQEAVGRWMDAHGGLTAYNVVNPKVHPLPTPPTEAPRELEVKDA